MNNMFKKIDSLPKKQNNKNNSCIVLCVVYSYIDSINIIYEFFKRKETNVSFTFYFIINNENKYDDAVKKLDIMNNTFIVKGDNSCSSSLVFNL